MKVKKIQKAIYNSLILIFIFINISFGKVSAGVIDPSNPVNSDKLKKTSITPVLDAKIEKGKNLVFCSTLQMAWNKICNDIAGEPLNVIDPPWYVKPLNGLMKQPALLGEDSYFSMAGFKRDNIVEKINKGLREKFKNLSESELVKVEDTLTFPYDIMAFSYLYKNLEFETPFDKTTPYEIKTGENLLRIKTFGVEKFEDNPKYKKLLSQIKVLYYKDSHIGRANTPEGFVIELKTKSGTDELIISTLKTEDTLEKTYKNIVKSIELNQVDNNVKVSCFVTPVIKFNVLHTYKELSGKKIEFNKYSDREYRLKNAIQKIDFTLNEKGARLISYSLIYILGSLHKMHLNVKFPFIVLLRSKDAEAPYFMAYIDNEELLETFNPDLIPVYTAKGSECIIEYTDEVKVPLYQAISSGASLKAIEKIIKAGANLNEVDKSGKRLIEYLLEDEYTCYGNHQAIKLLLENGADIGTSGVNLLKSILARSQYTLYDVVLKKKINFKGFTLENVMSDPEMADIVTRTQSLMQWLLKSKNSGIDTSEVLLYLISNSILYCEEFADELLKHGADINTKNEDGSTLLIVAVRKKMRPEFIKGLIKRGADVKILDQKGHDALYYAKENKMDDVVRMLEEKLK